MVFFLLSPVNRPAGLRRLLTKGLVLPGEPLSVTSLSRNAASVNQWMRKLNKFN